MPRSASWVAFVERRHRVILGASLVLLLLAALSLTRLRFDFDVLGMLPTGAPAFDNFKAFVADFGELDELVIFVEGENASSLHAFADTLAGRLRRLDTVASVQGKIEAAQIQQGILGRFVYNYLPVEEYARLRTRLTPAGLDAQMAANRAILQAPVDLSAAQWVRRDPLGIAAVAGRALDAAVEDATLNVTGGYLSTPDGSGVLILVRPTTNPFDIVFTTKLMQQVREAERAARQETRAADALRVRYTGSYAYALEDAATLKWDVRRYILLALVGVLAVFYAGYRNLRILPFVTYPLIVSTVLTFAASLLIYAQLNAVSVSFAAILYGLSIDSGIHYYTRLLQEAHGRALRVAVARTLAALGGANVVASATTAATFGIIGFSQLAGVSQLGVLTAIGMLINIAAFFVLYPALTFLLPRVATGQVRLDAPRLGALAAGAVRYRFVLLVLVGFAASALTYPALHVGFDVELTSLRPSDSTAAAVQDDIARKFGTSAATGAVLVRAPTLERGLQEAERVAAQLATYRARGRVRSIQTVTALLPSARTQRARLQAFMALPRDQIVQDLRAALARSGFVAAQFESFVDDFRRPHAAVVRVGDPVVQPFDAALARYIRQRPQGVTVATYVAPAPGVSLAAVAKDLRRDLPAVRFVVASRTLLQTELGHVLRRELVGFCAASFLLNLLLIVGNCRRVGLSLAILLPEGVVIVGFLATLDLLGVGIDPVSLVVVPLILGIGVDDCVYIGERYQRGEPPGEAVRHGGRALLVSSLTTMAGFGFLGLSHYPALARMGLFTAVSLFACLLAAVTLLPALLSMLAPRAGSDGSATR